ncbi:MAG: hypothetical protein HY042_02520 [Spirochaetia bacterium]|nr:hypothetical protein [Spirochaetia bacterium]
MAYAAYHLRFRSYLAALHASRRGLSQVLLPDGVWDGQRRSTMATLLRQLETEYDGLGRFQDRHTVRALATSLEDPDFRSGTDELKKAAGENLRNREALLFLLRLEPADQRPRLNRLLLERDKTWDDRELLSLYRDY